MRGKKIFRKNRNRLIGISCFFLLVACETNTIYHSYHHLPNGRWNKNDTLLFTHKISDSAALYKVSLEIRYQDYYPYRNLFLFIQRNTANSSFFITDTVEYILATPKGKWKGSGLGTLHQITFPYHTFSLPQNRNYSFKIGHVMKEEVLDGINDIGICIEKVNP